MKKLLYIFIGLFIISCSKDDNYIRTEFENPPFYAPVTTWNMSSGKIKKEMSDFEFLEETNTDTARFFRFEEKAWPYTKRLDYTSEATNSISYYFYKDRLQAAFVSQNLMRYSLVDESYEYLDEHVGNFQEGRIEDIWENNKICVGLLNFAGPPHTCYFYYGNPGTNILP